MWKALSENLEGQEISLKGYLYQTQDDRWILAEKPDLKSCCVGPSHQLDSQVILIGQLEKVKKNVPVNIKGTFHISPKYNEKGLLLEKYVLTEISFLEQKTKIPYWTLSVVILGFLLVRLFRRSGPLLP